MNRPDEFAADLLQVRQVASPRQHFQQQCRDLLQQGRQRLQAHYQQGARGSDLVRQQSRLTDDLLKSIWRELPALSGQAAPARLALVAVGGYGRGELHPHSDIDLLILLDQEQPNDLAFIETLIAFLWDIRLEVGHSVRRVSDCHEQAGTDISTATSLLEARYLCGDRALFDTLENMLAQNFPWSPADFFEAKQQEQRARHARFGDTAFNLEPNIKDGLGALRDIHCVEWVARRYFGSHYWRHLQAAGLISPQELHSLNQARHFLWRLRAGLHYAAARREDRLLFDYQKQLALELGYRDRPHSLAVEQLMKRYFRTVRDIACLTQNLNQTLREALLEHGMQTVQPLDADFQLSHGRIQVVDENRFRDKPAAIFALFTHLQTLPDTVVVSARSARALRASSHVINAAFRRDPAQRAAFLQLLQCGTGLTRILRLMHGCGVLGAYIPAFGRIIGQMQHDLFHVYTVDQHTLFLVRNLRRFAKAEYQQELPLCSRVYGQLDKPMLLMIAGLFHDIAKGRGGDHSKLGAQDARRFCRQHGLGPSDTALVEWLVSHHLVMSAISQRRDLEDPEVIQEFARIVGEQQRLDYLLLLTVADMRATNPSLWNGWKAQLLWDLYHATSKALQRDVLEPLDARALVHNKQTEALAQLQTLPEAQIRQFWQHLSPSYFLRHDADTIAWHSAAIINADRSNPPLVKTRLHRASTEILVFTPNRAGLFSQITGEIGKLGLNIVDARLNVTPDDFALDSFHVLDAEHHSISDPHTLEELAQYLRDRLCGHSPAAPTWRTSRRLRRQQHFGFAPQVRFDNQILDNYTVMEVIAPDRPGLLHHIADVLQNKHIQVEGAKIATFGERAEDVFFLIDQTGNKLNAALLDTLHTSLLQTLETLS